MSGVVLLRFNIRRFWSNRFEAVERMISGSDTLVAGNKCRGCTALCGTRLVDCVVANYLILRIRYIDLQYNRNASRIQNTTAICVSAKIPRSQSWKTEYHHHIWRTCRRTKRCRVHRGIQAPWSATKSKAWLSTRRRPLVQVMMTTRHDLWAIPQTVGGQNLESTSEQEERKHIDTVEIN